MHDWSILLHWTIDLGPCNIDFPLQSRIIHYPYSRRIILFSISMKLYDASVLSANGLKNMVCFRMILDIFSSCTDMMLRKKIAVKAEVLIYNHTKTTSKVQTLMYVHRCTHFFVLVEMWILSWWRLFDHHPCMHDWSILPECDTKTVACPCNLIGH